MHIKVIDRLCFPCLRYIIASGMSGSNKIFEIVAARPIWTQRFRVSNRVASAQITAHIRNLNRAHQMFASARSGRICFGSVPAMRCIVSSDVATAITTRGRAAGEEETKRR